MPDSDLFCRESAATFRFMLALRTRIPGSCRLVPGDTLARRPVKPLLAALSQLGADVFYNEKDASVSVRGGRLPGGLVSLPGDISSQFVSALLLAAPMATGPVSIRLSSPAQSRAYLLMTLETMKHFGVTVDYGDKLGEFQIRPQAYRPAVYTVEGDWSSAAFLLAAGALSGEVTVTNLNTASLQSDTRIAELLQTMGAPVTQNEDGSLTVSRASLRSLEADLNECIDLLPVMAVLAAAARGTSRFSGIARARLKESDRVAAVREGLSRLGIATEEETDVLSVTGGTAGEAIIDSRQDHRIAMAFAVLGTQRGNLSIDGAECVAKTFPAFWEALSALGGLAQEKERQSDE